MEGNPPNFRGQPTSENLLCFSGHEWFNLHSWSWENPMESAPLPTLVCVHGLTRNGRDFDFLAKHLLSKKNLQYKRVVCPDVVGRGKSGWLTTHYQDYGYPLYTSSISSLLAHHLVLSDQKSIDFVGTSMGGLIGMMLATVPNSPIRKLVLNDIGAEIPRESLVRIAQYASKPPPVFDTEKEVVEYMMNIHAPFGLSQQEWESMVPFGIRRDEITNKITLGYDPHITHAFSGDPEKQEKLEFWELWKAIKCPVMIVRGEKSDLLTEEIVNKMKETNEMLVDVLVVKGVGHAPGLANVEQSEAIAKFLAQ